MLPSDADMTKLDPHLRGAYHTFLQIANKLPPLSSVGMDVQSPTLLTFYSRSFALPGRGSLRFHQ